MKRLASLFILIITFHYSLSCLCPSKPVTTPPAEVPKFEDFYPENVIIEDKDYGIPIALDGYIYLQRYVKTNRYFVSLPHSCPTGYLPPTKEQLDSLIVSLNGNYSIFTSEEGFNLTEDQIIISSTKFIESTDSTNPASWSFWGLRKENGVYKMAERNTYYTSDLMAVFCTAKDDKGGEILYDTDGVIKNKITTFSLADPNVKGILWKVNFEIFKTKELRQRYKDNNCYLIEVWYYNIADKLNYACLSIKVDNPYYIDKDSSFSLDKVKTIDTGIRSNVQTGIYFHPSNGPLSPKLNGGGFYVFYRLDSNGHLHILEYNDKYEQVQNKDLNIDGYPQDIAATEWGFIILYAENAALKLTGYYDDFTLRFNNILFGSGRWPKRPTEQIIFSYSNGVLAEGMTAMDETENGKLVYASGMLGVIFAHYNDFQMGQASQNRHTGDSIIVFDVNGENAKLGYAWGASHSLVQSIMYNGKTFVSTSLGDAYPENVQGCVINQNIFGSDQGIYFDKLNEKVNEIYSKCVNLHPKGFPGDTFGSSGGRVGSLHYNGEVYAIPYSVLPCNGASVHADYDEVGLLTFQVTKNAVINVERHQFPGLSAKKIMNIRSGQYGKNILITYIETDKEMSGMPQWQNLGFNYQMSYLFVNFEGKVITGPIKSPEFLMNMSDDLRFLENGSLVWTSIVTGGTLKINYSPKLL